VKADVSIILSSVNGGEALFRCLESILNQTYPLSKVELIVVDYKYDKATARSLEEGDYSSFCVLKYLPLLRKGSAAAKNIGISNALSGLLVFIDDDCIVDCDWLKWIAGAHSAHPDKDVIAGLTYVSQADNAALTIQFLAGRDSIFNGGSRIFSSACNVSVKSRVFDRHLFNEAFVFSGGGDLEFFLRIFGQGCGFAREDNAKVIRSRVSGFYGFLKESFFKGRSDFLTVYLHKSGLPELNDLKAGNWNFFPATFLNFLKLPVFGWSYSLRLIKQEKIGSFRRRAAVCLFMFLYRVFYLAGTIYQFYRLKRKRNSIKYPVG
jgi:glycosyltransferase involved in cell wall biosynthesis